MTVAKRSVAAGLALDVKVPSGLDWQEFSAAHFPGSRRHDLSAIVAYGAYRRSLAVGEPSPQDAARIEEAESELAGSTAVEGWEDEGGAAP